MLFSKLLTDSDHFINRRNPVNLCLVHHLAGLHKMQMGIIQTGNQCLSAAVCNFGIVSRCFKNFFIGSDLCNQTVLHKHCLCINAFFYIYFCIM